MFHPTQTHLAYNLLLERQQCCEQLFWFDLASYYQTQVVRTIVGVMVCTHLQQLKHKTEIDSCRFVHVQC